MQKGSNKTVVLGAAAIAFIAVMVAGLLVISWQSTETRREVREIAALMKGVQDDTQGLKQALAAQQEGLTKTGATVAATAKDVAALKDEVLTSSTTLAITAKDVVTLKDELSKSNTTLATTAKDVAALQVSLVTAASKLDTNVSETRSLQSQVTSLASDQDSVKKRVDTLDQGVTGVKVTVDKIATSVATIQQGLASSGGQQAAAGAPARITVSDTLGLRLDPIAPLAGQDIGFAAEGLEPWQRLSVGFLDSNGAPMEWVTENEATYSWVGGKPVTQTTVYADSSGRASWLRIGTLDGEGTWKVQLKVGDTTYTAPYQVSQLQLNSSKVSLFGMDLRRYQGMLSDAYYSAGVPAAQVLTLQSHLHTVRLKLSERLGIQSARIPDLYLFANRSLFEKAGGRSLLSGFYTTSAPYPGIYIKADTLVSEQRQTLTHEYVHLLLAERAPRVELPAWVNEGTATYYELSLGLESERLVVSQREVFSKADRVRQAATTGSLIPLAQLESLREWNAQTDPARVSQQYAQAYMAVRYLVERFGEKGLVALLNDLSQGTQLPTALQRATGVSYSTFESDWKAWLTNWQDSEREAVRQYYIAASSILKDWDTLSQKRSAQLSKESSSTPLSARLPSRQEFLSTAKTLEAGADQLVVPSSQQGFHQELRTFLGRTVAWLQLELEYVQTGNDARRVQANAMIPEVDTRESGVARGLSSMAFNYQL